MTLIGHGSTSALAGLLCYRFCGGNTVGTIVGSFVATFVHMPMDIVLNEFWRWGDDVLFTIPWINYKVTRNHLKMVLYSLPALALMVVTALLLGSKWWLVPLFGLLGSLLDMVDGILDKVLNLTLFHYDTNLPMLSIFGTATVEFSWAVVLLIATILLNVNG